MSKTLKIISAFYGANDSWIDVSNILNNEIVNNSLNIIVNNNLFGDPILNHVKQLQLKYTLDNKKYENITDENKRLIINTQIINILCDNYHERHRNVVFYISSLIFKNAFQNSNITCNIIFDTTSNISDICDKTIVFTYPHLFNKLTGINCKIILYNSECLLLNINKEINKYIKDDRILYVLDYTYKNILFTKSIKHIFIPPVYSNIQFNGYLKESSMNKDIDILFYGASDPNRHYRRFNIKSLLVKENINLVWVETFNNLEEKYQFISRSKIILIIHTYTEDLPIDYFRMTELIFKKQFFIMEAPQKEDEVLYEKYKNNIVFSDYDNIVKNCKIWLSKTEKERKEKAQKLYEYYKNNENINNYFNSNFIENIKNPNIFG